MARRLCMEPVRPARRASVSDHALLRWLERSLKIDMEKVRASILTRERIDAIACGAVKIHCPAEGVTLIVAPSGTVKTVLPIKDKNQ